MTVEGSYVAKSGAGEHDITLEMLGIHTDGCKNITEEQNSRYTEWLIDSIGRQTAASTQFYASLSVLMECMLRNTSC